MARYDHFAKHRQAVNLLLEDFVYHDVTPEIYAEQIRLLDHDRPGRRFATCFECGGIGCAANPAYDDSGETDNGETPDTIDCEQCNGSGFLEIKVHFAAPIIDEDMPF